MTLKQREIEVPLSEKAVLNIGKDAKDPLTRSQTGFTSSSSEGPDNG